MIPGGSSFAGCGIGPVIVHVPPVIRRGQDAPLAGVGCGSPPGPCATAESCL